MTVALETGPGLDNQNNGQRRVELYPKAEGDRGAAQTRVIRASLGRPGSANAVVRQSPRRRCCGICAESDRSHPGSDSDTRLPRRSSAAATGHLSGVKDDSGNRDGGVPSTSGEIERKTSQELRGRTLHLASVERRDFLPGALLRGPALVIGLPGDPSGCSPARYGLVRRDGQSQAGQAGET
jgi:hypothetical protein